MTSSTTQGLHTNTVRAIARKADVRVIPASESGPFMRSGIRIERETEFYGKQHHPTGRVIVSHAINPYAEAGTRARALNDFRRAVEALAEAGLTIEKSTIGAIVSR